MTVLGDELKFVVLPEFYLLNFSTCFLAFGELGGEKSFSGGAGGERGR